MAPLMGNMMTSTWNIFFLGYEASKMQKDEQKGLSLVGPLKVYARVLVGVFSLNLFSIDQEISQPEPTSLHVQMYNIIVQEFN